MNVSNQRYTIATRPQLLTPAGRFWLCYLAGLVAVAAWWLA